MKKPEKNWVRIMLMRSLKSLETVLRALPSQVDVNDQEDRTLISNVRATLASLRKLEAGLR